MATGVLNSMRNIIERMAADEMPLKYSQASETLMARGERYTFGDVITDARDSSGGAGDMVMERPVPLALKHPEPLALEVPTGRMELTDFELEYEELSKSLGYSAAAITTRRAVVNHENLRAGVVEFMLDKGLPIYDHAEVHKFMDAIVTRENGGLMVSATGQRIVLSAAAAAEGRMLGLSPNQMANRKAGGLLSWDWVKMSDYGKTIPVEMLRRAKLIKNEFKDAEFSVTDYKVEKPDPFISFTMPGLHGRVVFGVWDEPGFGVDKK